MHLCVWCKCGGALDWYTSVTLLLDDVKEVVDERHLQLWEGVAALFEG